MARKKFLQDLQAAQNNPPAHITDILRYDGDGVSFAYWWTLGDSNNRTEVNLKLITTNIDEYPDGNQFMLFTDDIDVDPIITVTFAQIQAVIDGASIITALREISGGLHQAITLGLAENPIVLDSGSQAGDDSETDDFDNNDEDEYDNGFAYDDDANFGLDEVVVKKQTLQAGIPDNKFSREFLDAVKSDLRSTKRAGFKIGIHGDLLSAGVLCVSVRVTKLGISEEAMQAWGLSFNEYLVLLIRYQRGYKFTTQVMEEPTLSGPVEMRVGLSNTYKPNLEEVFAAFNQLKDEGELQAGGSLKPLFIGQPINDLLRSRFTKILKFRQRFSLSWGGAERLFNDRQGVLLSDLPNDLAAYKIPEDGGSDRALPSIVTEDTLRWNEVSKAPLPLVAMQFVLRHLVRCTEFCLVCHCKVENTFEALKPYVCSKPLCLYQFLAFGFGPAAEWEIISQPYVVDLLVSLCYLQARAARLREFPVGVNLKVAFLPHFKKNSDFVANRPYISVSPATGSSTPPASFESVISFKAKFDPGQKLLSPIDGTWSVGRQSVARGDWIAMVASKSQGQYNSVNYCCVADEQGSDFIVDNITTSDLNLQMPATGLSNSQLFGFEMDCYLYTANFDELPDQYRHNAITSLLDTLPTIDEMRKQLTKQQGGHRDPNLKLFKQCPPSAIDLLRWIIASNRSCIMQVDEVAAALDITQKLNPSEYRVSGMDDWMQFRFAQGAPDKEQRFVDCVKTKSANIQHPTLFAWHGSPLYNWHSIIRQGLNFDEVLHGRASGNGVYMSPMVNTSIGYTNSAYTHQRGGSWPNSVLKVSSVVSLQEVVNAPSQFISQSPHFVVAEKDWIQTRYLFVKTALRHSIGSTAKSLYQQDPRYTARGSSNELIAIPITAISKSRRPAADSHSSSKSKKRKIVLLDHISSHHSDDDVSVMTDEADCTFLDLKENSGGFDNDDVVMVDAPEVSQMQRIQLSHTLGSTNSRTANNRKRGFEFNEDLILDRSKTNFVPGNLDISGIRFLEPPKYASMVPSKALMRAFSDTIKVQKTTPLHELGFYIDPNRMDNMYQWIVELHSFDETLPLARDMKSASLTSIVLEMQFTNDYPFSPPFVRVVKPRFLDPMMGGGGHITSGGAICMELLTSNGWSAVNSMENVLLQVRLAVSERERPARLLTSRGGYQTAPYGVGEAMAAYKRFCAKHGWQAPKGFDSFETM